MSTDVGLVRRAGAAAALLAAVSTGLTACSDDESDPPDLGGEAATSDAPSETSQGEGGDTTNPEDSVAPPPGPPPAEGDKVPDSNQVSVGELPSAPADRVVAEALVAYVEARMKAFHDVDTSFAALHESAIGQALTDVEQYVAGLRDRGQHTVGELRVNVDKVKVSGRRAMLHSCIENATIDVNGKNVAVEQASPAYEVTATAGRVAKDTWIINSIQFQGVTNC